MNDDTMKLDAARQANLAEARQQSGTGEEESKDEGTEAGKPSKETPPWVVTFLAIGIYSLVTIPLALFLAPVVLVFNYLVVAGLWLWAKMRKLKPPTFGSSLKGPVGQAATGGAGAAAQATDAVPGADIAFLVFSSGITPLIYLSALWWNNR